MLTEDAREREYFDRNTSEMYGGEPLAQVQHTLATMSLSAPQGGSFARILAICANEIEKARTPPNANVTDLAKTL